MYTNVCLYECAHNIYMNAYNLTKWRITSLSTQNYSALQMFELSDEFFVSMGLIPAPEEFWNESMIVRPDDRDVVCHATAWDFQNRKDFRYDLGLFI